jgi:DNA-binding beta-propeller fold protein YncE
LKIFILLIIFFIPNTFAKEITPYRHVSASEAVSDFVKVNNTLVIATEEGVIDIYDLRQDKIVDKIVLQKQTNILGEEMGVLIMSVDYLNNKLIFLSRLLNTWGELYIYEDKKLVKLIDNSEQKTLQKLAFVDENLIIISTMSNELMLFDIKNKKFIYKKQLNSSSFSGFSLSEDKKYIFVADETPLINKIEIKSGKVIEEYEKANKRDIFTVEYKNNLLISGGKDKRVILYKTPNQYKMTKGDFFIYSVALNPEATQAAFSKNENDEISVIDTQTMNESYLLKGHKQTIIKIDFYMSDELITADESKQLLFWKLK